MQTDIVKIGNSKGVRLPAAVLKQCGIGTKVEMEIRHNHIILKPVRTPRNGWAAAFQRMSRYSDDQLLVPDEIDTHLMEEWDED